MFRYILEMLPESNSLKKIYNKKRRVQKLYLQPIVTQYLVCNKSEIWP